MDPLSSKTSQLFSRNRFAAHSSYVRENEVVPHFLSKSSYFMTKHEGKIIANSNSCLHRGMKLVTERRFLRPGQELTCPFHAWQYDKSGKLLSAPGFTISYHHQLYQIPLTKLNGDLFFETESLLRLPHPQAAESINNLVDQLGIDLSTFTFDQENINIYQHTWNVAAEVYLDCRHINMANKMTLGSYIDGDKVEWFFGTEWSLQVFKSYTLSSPSSLGWGKYKEQVQIAGWNKPWAAMFAMIYPGTMIEFYPYVMIITNLLPLSNKLTACYVKVFFDMEPATIPLQNAFLDAYSETAEEDVKLQEMLEDGRSHGWRNNHLYERGLAKLDEWEMNQRIVGDDHD